MGESKYHLEVSTSKDNKKSEIASPTLFLSKKRILEIKPLKHIEVSWESYFYRSKIG